MILCTGYTHQIESGRAARLGVAAVLLKPLTIDDLAHTVRSVLDRIPALASAAGGRRSEFSGSDWPLSQ